MPTPQDAADRKRGFRESQEKIPLLRAKWPLAFPAKNHEVRPLAVGIANEVAAAMDWPLYYAIGVLGGWKASKAYCRAVLYTERRTALDGTPAEPVDDDAKRMAKERLDHYAAKAAAKMVEQGTPTTTLPEQLASPPPQAPYEPRPCGRPYGRYESPYREFEG
jgi:sRNA-binding protein